MRFRILNQSRRIHAFAEPLGDIEPGESKECAPAAMQRNWPAIKAFVRTSERFGLVDLPSGGSHVVRLPPRTDDRPELRIEAVDDSGATPCSPEDLETYFQ